MSTPSPSSSPPTSDAATLPIEIRSPVVEDRATLRRWRRAEELRKLQEKRFVEGDGEGEMMDAAREPRRFTCEDCGQSFAKRAALTEHAKSHKPPTPPSGGDGDGDSGEELWTPAERISWSNRLTAKIQYQYGFVVDQPSKA